ncbi:hypothetical protein POM88_024071 [Heracleum sosnowskyi]|uniref:Uncharacterized protein n=1 Tax=Heracleum sosnowskyi TaxID=360622 RepID=A0AAD8IK13_9APIA|nr:hypothetical protein POM88_024071 [Heracleum sosnowskyi]
MTAGKWWWWTLAGFISLIFAQTRRSLSRKWKCYSDRVELTSRSINGCCDFNLCLKETWKIHLREHKIKALAPSWILNSVKKQEWDVGSGFPQLKVGWGGTGEGWGGTGSMQPERKGKKAHFYSISESKSEYEDCDCYEEINSSATCRSKPENPPPVALVPPNKGHNSPAIFDVLHFGAKGDGNTDDTKVRRHQPVMDQILSPLFYDIFHLVTSFFSIRNLSPFYVQEKFTAHAPPLVKFERCLN